MPITGNDITSNNGIAVTALISFVIFHSRMIQYDLNDFLHKHFHLLEILD